MKPYAQQPMRAQMESFIAALLALEAAIPRAHKKSGELERRKPTRPGRDVVYLPGSGDAESIDQRGSALHPGTRGGQENAGPDTHNFEGLPGGNSGGGGGGGW